MPPVDLLLFHQCLWDASMIRFLSLLVLLHAIHRIAMAKEIVSMVNAFAIQMIWVVQDAIGVVQTVVISDWDMEHVPLQDAIVRQPTQMEDL